MLKFIVTQASFQVGCCNRPSERISELPSMTVPGQSIPLKTLLEKYVRGEHVEVFNPSFDDDFEDLPLNYERMTEIEKLDMARDIGESIREIQTRVKKSKPSDYPAPPDPPAPPASPAPVPSPPAGPASGPA